MSHFLKHNAGGALNRINTVLVSIKIIHIELINFCKI